MILFINTSQTNLIQLKLIKNDQVVCQLESQEEFKQAELILSMINKVLKKKKLKIENLKLIVIVSGPGAFSALRLGVTTANALAWSLRIPVVELSVDEVESDEMLINILKEKIINPQSSIISPKYGKEPNITKTQKTP